MRQRVTVRQINDLDAMAVLRGERDVLKANKAACCAKAMQRAIDVLEGRRKPLGPATSLELDRKKKRR